jgi:hypothetical protein
MEEDADILAIARELVKRFGPEAVGIGEERAEAHRLAEESEGAELWRRVADATRMVLAESARELPHGPS